MRNQVIGQSGTVYPIQHCTHEGVNYTLKEDGRIHLCLNEGVTFIKAQSGTEYPVCAKCGKMLPPMLSLPKDTGFCYHPGVYYRVDENKKIRICCESPENDVIYVDMQPICKKCGRIIYPPVIASVPHIV